MSVVRLHSAHILGLSPQGVDVEVDVSSGLYSFSIVGLPDKTIDESRDRIIAALKNTGLKNPKTENHKVVVSLAPAHIKKEGSHFDLPIALGYLLASKQISHVESTSLMVGELSLNGEIKEMRGILPITQYAKQQGYTHIFVPHTNKDEAALVEGITVYGVRTLRDIALHHGGLTAESGGIEVPLMETPRGTIMYNRPDFYLDMHDIQGQDQAKRALLIAAAGGHNILLYGPPGTGKTMLARAFASILPPLSHEEVFEVTSIHSITSAGNGLVTHPPFRSPHHTSSHVSIVGGGAYPRPGEITLAHRGVLFLDEFPEFDKRVIESLRQPLEEGVISVARAKGTSNFPAVCTLVAAMNPCPCGYLGSNVKRCTCTPSDINKYAKKLSGPIMDRIDMWVPVRHIDFETLSHAQSKDTSDMYKELVEKARAFAHKRYKDSGRSYTRNRDIHPRDIPHTLHISKEADLTAKTLATSHTLSPRSYHRVLRLARTIADIRGSTEIAEADVLEAFQYRPKLYESRV